ncbi:hypothetical protein D8B26_005943 [Coccidioides posadasii str. Silveira]|uniref:Serine protease n=3 Tax=Coccidioides posadasii TaxID=199306 RepID=E9DI85_COCPS|nr:hypothetical protein CPC735_032740 [Coccidioides posadasii C735 delta SOWgp]EER27938.1 hypothetical protein CPC735_032740 [Coccidioides posadasii C735 delta SOWgp]EFW13881.1 conserved hypothetical protein [Coccidioides posadasii str. Silveira]KMM67921.1 hypothetical protein CPAG_04254 [Coccidioides posadasii RMSCC 3488]QVM11290.1 hypothetical protein D8B26_005943 [Coccidioides posadasii str. Silveira]|eukprot:XP_003070083.1 hypothetical protein CPC735_032740 [Coccidioides posadasii C735 delta SOWgp]
MHFLQVVSLFVVSYILSAGAAPLMKCKPSRPSCPQNVPLLEAEQLYVDDPAGYRSPFWNFGASDEVRMGGTPGYNPDSTRWNQATNSPSQAGPQPNNSAFHAPEYYSGANRDQILSLKTYPWNTVGRVSFKRFKGDKGGWCTGTLVGRDLILTASHCFPWGYGDDRWMRFSPGFANDTEPYGGSYVSRCRGVKNTFNVTGIDYVVCHLCQPLGEKVGWMGTRWWKDESVYMGRSWSSSGYPVDSYNGQAQMFIPSLNFFEIEYHADLGVELESLTFASAGWSGGPTWGYLHGQPTIVGVCSGAERDCSERVGGCLSSDTEDYHDVSAGGKLMTDLVLYAMHQWRSG